MSHDEPTHRNSIVGGLLILLARCILLWLVVPIASLVWVFVAIRLRRSGIRVFPPYVLERVGTVSRSAD